MRREKELVENKHTIINKEVSRLNGQVEQLKGRLNIEIQSLQKEKHDNQVQFQVNIVIIFLSIIEVCIVKVI